MDDDLKVNSPYPRLPVPDTEESEERWRRYRNQVVTGTSLFAALTYACAFVFGIPGMLLCFVCNGIWLLANVIWIPYLAFIPGTPALRSIGRTVLLLAWHLAVVIGQMYIIGPLD